MAEILTFEKKYEEIRILLCKSMNTITLDFLLKVRHFFVLWVSTSNLYPMLIFFRYLSPQENIL